MKNIGATVLGTQGRGAGQAKPELDRMIDEAFVDHRDPAQVLLQSLK
jgi:hypothetical protein